MKKSPTTRVLGMFYIKKLEQVTDHAHDARDLLIQSKTILDEFIKETRDITSRTKYNYYCLCDLRADAEQSRQYIDIAVSGKQWPLSDYIIDLKNGVESLCDFCYGLQEEIELCADSFSSRLIELSDMLKTLSHRVNTLIMPALRRRGRVYFGDNTLPTNRK